MAGRLLSVNVGGVRSAEHHGRPIQTGIFKSSVEGPVAVRGVNLAGDQQADLENHGGEHKAVYAYAHEDATWWTEEIDREIDPGSFGENLTTVGVDVSDALVGEQWRIGTVVLEVSEPRIPCFKLGIAMGDGQFPLRFKRADRPGAYLRIVEPGVLEEGDVVEVIARPENSLSVAEIARIHNRDRQEAERLLAIAALSDSWRHWAQQQIRP